VVSEWFLAVLVGFIQKHPAAVATRTIEKLQKQ